MRLIDRIESRAAKRVAPEDAAAWFSAVCAACVYVDKAAPQAIIRRGGSYGFTAEPLPTELLANTELFVSALAASVAAAYVHSTAITGQLPQADPPVVQRFNNTVDRLGWDEEALADAVFANMEALTALISQRGKFPLPPDSAGPWLLTTDLSAAWSAGAELTVIPLPPEPHTGVRVQ